MKKYVLIGVLALLVLYVASYLWLRASRQERWERDGQVYVILPQSTAIYYIYRPFTYLDARLTGMGFHIGPHH